jgi:hypothetical protein
VDSATTVPQKTRMSRSEEMTMIRKALAVATFGFAVLVIAALTPALADSPVPDSEEGRYAFSKVDDGFLRLDSQTGLVSLCSRRAVGWACQTMPEDRAVFEGEIARLRTENAALKKDLLSRGLPLPAGAMPEPPVIGEREPALRLPNNADIDRVMAFVGRMWRRLVEMIATVQKDVLRKS